MKVSLFLFLCTVLALFSSCGSYNKVLKTSDYEYKYEMAKQYYAQGYYNRAALLLTDVLAVMKGTDKGEESLYLLGMSSYNAHDYEAAAAYFKKYYESYPKGLFVEEAFYNSGNSLYKNVPSIKLDQSATYDAVAQFQSFLERFPNSKYRDEVQNKIFALQDRLVEKEYLSAKLYYDLGTYFLNSLQGGSNYEACIITAENAIKDYPYTSMREQFAILILKAKFDLANQSIESKREERVNDAIDEYYGFTNEFPESSFMPEATALFNKIKKRNTQTEEKVQADIQNATK